MLKGYMDKERLKKLAENPQFIPGVYNYCDRWCERCPFTGRCMTFALSEEHFGDSETRDINNKAFWEKLSEIFRLTLEMVKEDAKREGIDLNSIDIQAASDEEEKTSDIAESQECCRAAKVYGEMVKNWFGSAEKLLEEKESELNLQAQLELPNCEPAGEAAAIKDSIDVIYWYQHQIYVKLKRAVCGTIRNGIDEDSSDANGSAKVALIGIERSIAAWGQMHKHFPEQQNSILDILLHLDRLRRTVETAFPDARAFVRPGFDEI